MSDKAKFQWKRGLLVYTLGEKKKKRKAKTSEYKSGKKTKWDLNNE